MTAELTTAYQQETLCEIQLTKFGLESRTRSICIPSFEDGLFRLITEDGSQNLQKGWELGGVPTQSNGWENKFCRYAMAAYAAWTRLGNRHYFLASIPCTELFFDTHSFARSKVHISHKML